MRPKSGMEPCFSRCGPLTSSTGLTWELLAMQSLGPTADLLHQGLCAHEGLRSQEEGRLCGLLITDSWLARHTRCHWIPIMIWKVDTILCFIEHDTEAQRGN